MTKTKLLIMSLICFIIILSMFSNVFAAELNTRLDIINKSSETKYLENDQGFISKTIVDSNAETGEVTIELKLSNTSKEVEKNIETEVMFVIDNSPSMEYEAEDGTIRKDNVINAAKSLTEKLFDNLETVKIGMLYFSGGTASTSDAIIACKLTNNKDTVIQSLDTLAKQATWSGTNILAGITKANNTFSSTCTNKIIILLTDGVPNGDLSGNVFVKKQDVYNNTKNGLITIGNSGTYIISIMTGIASDAEDSEDIAAVEEIFGTQSSPTAGSFYNVSDLDINKIVTEDILADIMEKVQNPINTVKIVDYFPEDITENFEFSYVENSSIGTVSDAIDTENKTITWDIGTLKGDEVATLKYKLKIKDMKNVELLNKTIATNEKVVLTYNDTDAKDYTVTLTSSPTIQLSEIKEELTATVSYDPTTTTTENVTAIIKTNKKVNAVEGWSLSEDGMTLTKVYSSNANETVHLVDEDNMTKDVEIIISNITAKIVEEKDNTTAEGVLPQTGIKTVIGIMGSIFIITLFTLSKYRKFKDI